MSLEELRSAWRTDPEFKAFLGVEYRDLEPGVAPLAYALWKYKVVKMRASCHGHAARQLPLHKNHVASEGNAVYSEAFLIFEEEDPDRLTWFMDEIKKLAAAHPFVRYRPPAKDVPLINTGIVTLDMLDIATGGREDAQVPEGLAQARLTEFREMWDNLALRVVEQFG